MAISYKIFSEMEMELSPVGVITGAGIESYFCTPKNAEIFGRAGVDGIHYCFIRGFEDMVFTVSPMNTPGNHVHAVANSFEDFLRLLLSCGDAAAIEQAWMWDLAEFEAFLKENQPRSEQKAVLSELAARTGLRPMERPWQYIKELQTSFDSSKIEFTEEYYDPDMNPDAELVPPPWDVYFEGGFWGYCGRDKAGTEIPINREFEFAGHRWVVPAVYSCGKGLVVDLCMCANPEDIRAFMEKWDLLENEEGRPFTREEQMEMEADNPLCLNFDCKVFLNGKELQSSHGYGTSHNPCVPEGFTSELEAKWIVDHYGLDQTCGWFIWRYSFPWKTKKRPDLHSLSLFLRPDPVSAPGPRFRVHAPGDKVTIVHPETGMTHTLSVVEYEEQKMDFSRMPDQNREYPPHFTAMSCRISPELSQEEITISDCADSDQPRRKQPDPLTRKYAYLPEDTVAAAIGIIGGADGPTAMIIGSAAEGSLFSACSSLHFEPVDDVEWRITFRVNRFEEKTIELVM